MPARRAPAASRLKIVPKSEKIDLLEVMKATLQSCENFNLSNDAIEAAMKGAVRGLVGDQGLPGKDAIAIISSLDNSMDPRSDQMVALKTKPKTYRPRRNTPALPTGKKFAEWLARGLARWRLKQGLSVPQAADQLGFDRLTWYRIETGAHRGAAGQNIDELAEKTGMHWLDLLKLGEKP